MNPATDADLSNLLDTSHHDHFSALPVELKTEIIRLLHARDRVSLRSLSRDFNSLCLTEGLFDDGLFTLRPHIDDMTRLQAVSGHREIAKGVRHLKFFVGDVRTCSLLRDTLRFFTWSNCS